MRRIFATLSVLTLGALGALVSASPANAVDLEIVPDGPINVIQDGACEEIEFVWTQSYQPGTTLVVSVDGSVQTSPSGTSLVLIPSTAPRTVYWRVFGGPERDWDFPLWNGYVGGGPAGTEWKAAITKYAADNGGWGWTLGGPNPDNPFLTWNEFYVPGCVDPQEPTINQPDECDERATIDLPDGEGVIYKIKRGFNTWVELEDGQVVLPGWRWIKAVPAEGYVFDSRKQFKFWKLKVEKFKCEEVTPVEPIVQLQGECGEPGNLTITDQEGVIWKWEGEVLESGVHQFTGTITIVAEAAPGYKLTGETEFTYTFVDGEPCPTPGEESPSPTPGTVTPPPPPPPPPSPSTNPIVPAGNSSDLARTGDTTAGKIMTIVGFGLLLGSLGGLAIVVSRRRRTAGEVA